MRIAVGCALLASFHVAQVRSADAQSADARSGTRIEYRTTGLLPGAGRDEKPGTVFQKITVDSTGSKLLYEETREGAPGVRRVLLRADGPKPVIYELLDGNRYKEHEGDLNQLQKERNTIEQNEILSAKHLPKKEREAFFKESSWLREDGTRTAAVSLKPAGKVLGFACQQLVVKENGRIIIEGDVAKLPIAGGGPFQLYRKLGAFSDEVLEAISKVDDVLLKGKITVVHPLKANVFEVEATSVESVPVDSKLFEVTGLTRVEEPKEVKCAFCGKPVDPKAPGGRAFLDGVEHFYCSEECKVKGVARYRESQRDKKPETPRSNK